MKLFSNHLANAWWVEAYLSLEYPILFTTLFGLWLIKYLWFDVQYTFLDLSMKTAQQCSMGLKLGEFPGQLMDSNSEALLHRLS